MTEEVASLAQRREEHEPAPRDGETYYRHGAVLGRAGTYEPMAHEYPLTCVCTCGRTIRRPARHRGWQHVTWAERRPAEYADAELTACLGHAEALLGPRLLPCVPARLRTMLDTWAADMRAEREERERAAPAEDSGRPHEAAALDERRTR